ncbi:hypothetical protein GCM10023093_16510 [Nemorincola caseinilytica]|uniref:Uncharacterized protein n=1 Tax=Nemorincola caseinilytica TaxID=2054315 RepID=A0ABP8NCV2_9BACT
MYTDQQSYSLSVNEAMRKGKWQLLYIPLSVLFGPPFLILVITPLVTTNDAWLGSAAGPVFLAAFTLPFIYYFIAMPRWRIWAFLQVRNVHELKERAILERILPRDGSWIWKLQITSAQQRAALAAVEQRFLQADVFIDDQELPYETTFKPSETGRMLMVASSIVWFGVAIYFVTRSGASDSKSFLLFGLVVIFIIAVRTFKKNAVLTMSNEGIKVSGEHLHPWRDIANEHIYFVNAGRDSHYKLSFTTEGKEVEISLRGIARSGQVHHAMRVYRGRYRAQNNI